MEFDTGAYISVINQTTYSQISRGESLQKTYNGESIPVIGTVNVNVKHKGQQEVLPVLVVEGTGFVR